MAASSRGKDSAAVFGFALRKLSPGSVPAHWNSWEGAEVSLILDSVQKISQHLLKTCHFSNVTPTSISSITSLGPRVAVSF